MEMTKSSRIFQQQKGTIDTAAPQGSCASGPPPSETARGILIGPRRQLHPDTKVATKRSIMFTSLLRVLTSVPGRCRSLCHYVEDLHESTALSSHVGNRATSEANGTHNQLKSARCHTLESSLGKQLTATAAQQRPWTASLSKKRRRSKRLRVK